jgi:hypothetical protein
MWVGGGPLMDHGPRALCAGIFAPLELLASERTCSLEIIMLIRQNRLVGPGELPLECFVASCPRTLVPAPTDRSQWQKLIEAADQD